MIQKGICAECGNEYEYEYNPKFPRKYCFECSAKKKAEFAGSAPKPVNAPVMKIPADGKVGVGTPIKKDGTTFYTAYAKDIFVAMYEKDFNKEDLMNMSINLVKQAREAFE